MPDELIEASAPIAVIGAGTMGAGIAQVAAVAGHPVLVYDAAPGAAERAVGAVRDRDRLAGRQGPSRLTRLSLRLDVARELDELAPARCVVEAVVEDLAVKQALFADLEKVVTPGCVLATNTSSLSPTAIAAALSHPGRLVGMHFFNPAPVMRLVEVVSGLATRPEVAAAVTELAQSWGKQVVRAAATPGFIVNRVARPVLRRSPAAGRGTGRRAGHDRCRADSGGRVQDGSVRADGSRRAGRERGGHPVGLGRLRIRPQVRALAAAARPGRGRLAGPQVRPRLVPLRRRRATAAILGRLPAARRHPGSSSTAPSPLRTLLGRSTAEVRAGADDDGTVELPSGARLVRCDGRPATALAAERGVPVVVVDRTLDDATATGIAVAACDGCPAPALDEAVGLLQAAGPGGVRHR